MYGPNPKSLHPWEDFPQICFINNTIDNPNVTIGDFTYYDDPVDSENFSRNILYHYPFIGDRLIIGRFCAIARETKFIMNGGNHNMDGITTYPFEIFPGTWRDSLAGKIDYPYKGDTVIGNDVWIGYEALIMPGVTVGDGAIIASRSVVSQDVPAYAIVAGNPAQVVRYRFDEISIEKLLALRWWDWDIDMIARSLPQLVAADLDALMAED